MNIIHSQNRFKPDPQYIFHATVILECPKNMINEFINFPPVFRNFTIKNDSKTIGQYMYTYGKSNHINSIDKSDTKLTMTVDTMHEFKGFGCYYLWFLIDHGLKVIDVKSVSLYDCHRGFNTFVNEFMNNRIEILSGNVKGNEKFFKISMNGSYGYDGLNSEHYNKIKIVDSNKAYQSIISDTYMNRVPLSEDSYLIQSQPKSFRCKTCIQEFFSSLSIMPSSGILRSSMTFYSNVLTLIDCISLLAILIVVTLLLLGT